MAHVDLDWDEPPSDLENDRQRAAGSLKELPAELTTEVMQLQHQQTPEAETAPGDQREEDDAWRGLPPSARSTENISWDENRTDTTAIDAEEQQNASEYWDCCYPQQLPPIEAEDLVRAGRVGPDRLVATRADKPRRVAVCHNITGQYGKLLGYAGPGGGSDDSFGSLIAPLARQDSGAPPLASVLLVKYYDTHSRLGVYHGHEGTHLGDLALALEPGSQFTDLCVSNRYQLVYLVDQANSRVYAVDLAGRLRYTISKRLAGAQAAASDDQHSLLFVCLRRKVRVFQQLSDRRHAYLRSLKSAGFRNLVSASARDGRLWLADSLADRVYVYAARDTELDLLHSIDLKNPQGVSLDASGSAFVTAGEPLHCVTVYGPEGCEVGSFGGWGSKQSRMKLPTGVCAYQLSHLVDKRMVVLCSFGEHSFRMYSLRNPDTTVI